MFQFHAGNPFAKVKKEMQEGMYKRMATDAEEDDRLKAQKKKSTFQKDGKTGKRNRPRNSRKRKKKNTKLKYRVVSINLVAQRL